MQSSPSIKISPLVDFLVFPQQAQSLFVHSRMVFPYSCQRYWKTKPSLSVTYLANFASVSSEVVLGHDFSWQIPLTGNWTSGKF